MQKWVANADVGNSVRMHKAQQTAQQQRLSLLFLHKLRETILSPFVGHIVFFPNAIVEDVHEIVDHPSETHYLVTIRIFVFVLEKNNSPFCWFFSFSSLILVIII